METEIREILELTDKNTKRATITIVQVLKGKHKHCEKIIFFKRRDFKKDSSSKNENYKF